VLSTVKERLNRAWLDFKTRWKETWPRTRLTVERSPERIKDWSGERWKSVREAAESSWEMGQAAWSFLTAFIGSIPDLVRRLVVGPPVGGTRIPEGDLSDPALRAACSQLQQQISMARTTLENVSIQALAVIAIDLAAVQAIDFLQVTPHWPVFLGAAVSSVLALVALGLLARRRLGHQDYGGDVGDLLTEFGSGSEAAVLLGSLVVLQPTLARTLNQIRVRTGLLRLSIYALALGIALTFVLFVYGVLFHSRRH
jgi:hypothetical protein